jgi:hypothetical protein
MMDTLFSEILWNDPVNENGFDKNYSRGGACYTFGPDKTKEFIE